MKSESSLSSSCVEKTYWGEVDGKSVWLYKLSVKSGLQMNVTNYGAIVQSLFLPDKDSHYTDVVLGYDSLGEYIVDPFYLGAVVGRCTNRIAKGEVKIDNKNVQLSLTPGGFHQHGGHVGFNKKVWHAEPFINDHSIGITLTYTSPDGEEGYPGNLDVTVVYTLQENKWSVDFLATTDQTTIVNLTQHSYFNLGGNAKGTIVDHVMKSEASMFLPATEKLMPTGDVAIVQGTPFDFLGGRKIGELIDSKHTQLENSLGYDHFFVLEKVHTPSLKKAATIKDPLSARCMTVLTTEPGFHFYTGNFLASSFAGKNDAVYQHRSGFCIETHHFPDAPNHPEFPSIILKSGDQFKSRTEFIFD